MNDNTPNEDTNSQVSELNESQEVTLRRSQRERKSVIPSIYETSLLGLDLQINKDPIFFLEAMNSIESEKGIDSMKEELKSMQENKVYEIFEVPKDANELAVSGSLRPSETQMEISNDIKPDLLLNDMLKRMVLIIKKYFLMFQRKTRCILS